MQVKLTEQPQHGGDTGQLQSEKSGNFQWAVKKIKTVRFKILS